jgi:ABC-type glycerol-3-phosphate transport system permease component
MNPNPTSNLMRGALLIAFCAIWAAPMVYILSVAFSNPLAEAEGGVLAAFTTLNFETVLANPEFINALLNSLLIGFASTALIILIAVPAAFICATREFPGREQIEAWILSTRMMPALVVVLPYFLLFRSVNLLDTALGLIIMHVIVSLALAFFMLRSFFAELPKEILEAAYMEGAGVFRTLFSVALPQVKSGLVATAILVFIFSWNELAFAFTLAGGAVKTGPVAILSFMGFQNVQIGPLMAASTLLVLPIAALLIFAQKSLIRGLSFGAIKA